MAELFDVALEQSVLGSILLDNEILHQGLTLNPEWFHDGVHQKVAQTILGKMEQGDLASPQTLRAALQDDQGLQELGGPSYLVRLAGAAMSYAYKDHVKELRDLWARRVMVESMTEGLQELRTFNAGESPSAALLAIEGQIAEVASVATSKPLVKTWASATIDAIESVDAAYHNNGIVGTSTGIAAVDARIGGMAPADMIILAGRPSMGKTAIALQIAWNIVERGEGAFFGSLEMPGAQLVPRFASSMLASRGIEVPYFNIRTGRMSETEYRQFAAVSKEFVDLPFLIGEKECRSMPRLRSAARRAKSMFERQGKPLGLIVIDYLQLIEDPNAKSDYARVSAASSAIKSLAMDLNVPVLALSQLNRSVEMREPPIPKMSDLRESGKLEEDADLVMLAYRPAYYLQKDLEEETDPQERMEIEAALAEVRDTLSVFVPKARGGPPGRADLKMQPAFNRIWSE